MIEKCTVCLKGKFDYSMSDISLIPKRNPPEAEIEGLCDNCGAYIHIQFKAYQVEVTEFGDMMEDKEEKKYLFEAGSGQLVMTIDEAREYYKK